MPLYTSTFANLYVTGNSNGEALPGNHNLVGWAFDPNLTSAGTLLTNGTQYFTAIYANRSASITKLYWHVSTAGVTPTASQNEVGLYDSTGAKLVSANVDADISSTGLKTTTVTSTAVSAGSFYWVAMLFNAATAPTVARASGVTGIGTLSNAGLTAASFRFAVNGTSKTALDASITPASNSASGFGGPWAAIGV